MADKANKKQSSKGVKKIKGKSKISLTPKQRIERLKKKINGNQLKIFQKDTASMAKQPVRPDVTPLSLDKYFVVDDEHQSNGRLARNEINGIAEFNM